MGQNTAEQHVCMALASGWHPDVGSQALSAACILKTLAVLETIKQHTFEWDGHGQHGHTRRLLLAKRVQKRAVATQIATSVNIRLLYPALLLTVFQLFTA